MMTRTMVGLALLALGCGARSQEPVAPSDAAAAEVEADLASFARPEPVERDDRPEDLPKDADQITFEGADAEPAPTDSVVAQPERDPLPSMITSDMFGGPG